MRRSIRSDRGPVTVGSAARAIALSGFLVLIVLAMWTYPGGTSWNATTRGHDFWLNTLCDLLRRTAMNGEPNARGADLARAAMLMFAYWVGSSFWMIARAIAPPPRAAAVRVLGAASGVGIAGVALFPSDVFHPLHPYLIALAGLPALGAGVCALPALAWTRRLAAFVGRLAFLVGGVDLVLYLSDLSGPGLRAVAVLERLTLLLGILWIALAAPEPEP